MVALTVLATVAVGLLAGNELAVGVTSRFVFRDLTRGAAVAARARSARVFGRIMPGCYAVATVLVATLAIIGGRESRVLVASVAVLLVVSIVMSVVVLVPMNKTLETATDRSAEGAKLDAPAVAARWEAWHFARVGVLLAAFVMLVLAI